MILLESLPFPLKIVTLKASTLSVFHIYDDDNGKCNKNLYLNSSPSCSYPDRGAMCHPFFGNVLVYNTYTGDAYLIFVIITIKPML